MGEKEGLTLAEHFEKGADSKKAVHWYTCAAQQALDSNDFEQSIFRADRGLSLAALLIKENSANAAMLSLERTTVRAVPRKETEPPKTEGAVPVMDGEVATLWWLKSYTYESLAQYAEEMRCAEEMIKVSTPGSEGWFKALLFTIGASGALGNQERLSSWVEQLLMRTTDEAKGGEELRALARAATWLLHMGMYEQAKPLLSRLQTPAAEVLQKDFSVAAEIHAACGTFALTQGDLGALLLHNQGAAESWERAGHPRAACLYRTNVGYGYLLLGAYQEAEATLRQALSEAERFRADVTIPVVKQNLGLVLGRKGARQEAQTMLAETVEVFHRQGDQRMEVASRTYLAEVLLHSGDLPGAAKEAQAAAETLVSPPFRALALAMQASVYLAQKRDALPLAKEAHEILLLLGSLEEGEVLVRLVYAEALLASGDIGAAHAAMAEAREKLRVQAQKISNPAWRQSFLSQVRENVRTLYLAQEWLGA